MIKIVLLLACLLDMTVTQDYNRQDQWGGDCLTGKQQSPINIIIDLSAGCKPAFNFQLTSKDELYTQIPYDPKNINLQTPFTLSTINFTKASTSKIYNAIRFHFHHRSEHYINGHQFDLELHVVHQAEDESFAVLSILFEARENVESDPFDVWNLTTAQDVKQKFPIQLTTPKRLYNYRGSLTTPQCNQGVQWFVSEEAIPIKRENLQKMAELINEGKPNNRDLQMFGNRKIIEVGAICSILIDHSYNHRLRIQ